MTLPYCSHTIFVHKSHTESKAYINNNKHYIKLKKFIEFQQINLAIRFTMDEKSKEDQWNFLKLT